MALDTTVLRSRRALLAGTVGGLAVLAAQALGRPTPTLATHGDVHLGDSNSATTLTWITNTHATRDAFSGVANGSGTGVSGHSSSGTGVFGSSSSGNGVRGSTNSSSGTGVEGDAPGLGTGVRGSSVSGKGVDGQSDTFAGVYGLGETGYGVFGESGSGQGVKGFSATGTGVRGESVQGRGGLFSGGKAHIRLQPSSAATHPSSGQAGDIFLDASKRLWLCRGGTSWVRIV